MDHNGKGSICGSEVEVEGCSSVFIDTIGKATSTQSWYDLQ